MSALRTISIDEFSLTHSVDKRPKGEDFAPHIHDSYELFCLVKGEVDYIVEGNYYKLHPGAIMLIRSSETHNLVVNKSLEYERYVLNFTPNFLLKYGFSRELLNPYRARSLGEKNMYLPDEFEYISPLDVLEKIFKECEFSSSQDVVVSNLSALLCEINVAFKRKTQPTQSTMSQENELLSFVNENLTSDITIEKIASNLHISPSQVSRIFKKATGTSPHNYITTKRLIMFNKKIEKGTAVIQACHECGFHDYSSFYRLYKKRFGISPTER